MTPSPSPQNLNNEDLPEELVNVLRDLVKKYEGEDSWVRKQQLKIWKKNSEFFHGVQFIFWSESRQEWLAPDEKWFSQEEGRQGTEAPFYDFVVNIFKGHAESIISALSAETPAVRFPPDDADDEDDITTAKTYNKIADLIQRHNKAKMSLLNALFILWNEGVICAYHAPKSDRAFGVVEVPQYSRSKYCEYCDKTIPDDMAVPPKFPGMPDSQPPSQLQGAPGQGQIPGQAPQPGALPQESCPNCGYPLTTRPIITGFTEAPKTRIIWELYGPTFVQVPYYAKDQKEFGYLFLKKDFPIALLKHLYPQISENVDRYKSDQDEFERTSRSPANFSGRAYSESENDLACLTRAWFRPWIFDGLDSGFAAERDQLKKLFPSGLYCAFVGENYVEARDEDLDKYWTVGKGGLSTYIHSDAIGQPLVPIQELRNILVNLVQETVEHGIPSTFADTEVLDFDTYSNHEARPGMVFPVVRKPGESIGDAFYESGRATLSKELASVWKQLDQDGQFVVGSFPSIYGGPSEGNTRTASEYNSSRQMALQRLSITWSFIIDWWTRLMEKCVHLFVENVVSDEKYVVKENNNYVNVWIRQAEMTGRVGDVEAEGAENFPTTLLQKQDLFMKLLGLQDEFVKAALFDPENRRLICDIIGDPDLYIPGEDQRIKQSREIQMMIKNGQPIPPEPLVDEDDIHISTLKNFMVGPVGIDLKMTNPQAYQALTQHLQMHQQQQQQQQMQDMMMQGGPGQGPEQGAPGPEQQPEMQEQ